ncbi:MAG: hypothetical protein M1602_03085, partial [Firmicutes bacterium]|nr:hypothetical protein [Bacillota bacterium]
IRDPHDPRDLSDGGLQKLYIGTVPVYADKTRLHNRVTDWRAPVARLFYEGEVGPQSFKVEDDWVDVVLYLVRHVDIDKAALRGVYDQQVHPDYPLEAVAPVEGQEFLADDYLRSLLKTAAGSHLKDIVRSIQREQHAIIAEEHDHTVIVQGVAGSGKTSIALPFGRPQAQCPHPGIGGTRPWPPGRQGSSSAGGRGTRWTCTGISSSTRTGASTAGWARGRRLLSRPARSG